MTQVNISSDPNDKNLDRLPDTIKVSNTTSEPGSLAEGKGSPFLKSALCIWALHGLGDLSGKKVLLYACLKEGWGR